MLGRKPQGGESWHQAGACSLATAPFIGPMPSMSGTSIILVPHWYWTYLATLPHTVLCIRSRIASKVQQQRGFTLEWCTTWPTLGVPASAVPDLNLTQPQQRQQHSHMRMRMAGVTPHHMIAHAMTLQPPRRLLQGGLTQYCVGIDAQPTHGQPKHNQHPTAGPEGGLVTPHGQVIQQCLLHTHCLFMEAPSGSLTVYIFNC